MRINTRNISGLLLVALLVCTNLSAAYPTQGYHRSLGKQVLCRQTVRHHRPRATRRIRQMCPEER